MDGIDREIGLKSTMGNEQLLERLLKKFTVSYADFPNDFNEAQQQGQEESTRMAHSLKSNAGSLGAMGVHDKAMELEMACKENAANIQECADAVQSELLIVLESLKALD